MKKEDFRNGYRVLMLHQRGKHGGHNRPDWHVIKRISTNEQEFEVQLNALRDMRQRAENSDLLRIYSCVNRRDIEKAIRQFKFEQLEADYYDSENRHKFYRDVKNRFISALMSPRSRAETHFLIDFDYEEDGEPDDARVELKNNTTILLEYDTPNGKHFITEPYNPNNTPELEIKKDALIFIE